MTRIRLRNFWFQFHKWIGLLLTVAIIPISLTGAALVWDEGVERLLHPARYAQKGGPQRPLDTYVAAARAALKPGETLMRVELPKEAGDPVIATAAQPGQGEGRRPVRTILYLSPADAHLIERTRSDAGPLRIMHMIHGTLMIPGIGRPIVGWIGVAMLISCISGIWLWWPSVGNWLRGLRWRRSNHTDNNLHHLLGFWIALPLAALSFTGMWISFPRTFGQFDGAKAPVQGPPPAARAKPLTQPRLRVDDAVALAGAAAPGGVASIDWPTDQAGWRITLDKSGGGRTMIVDDAKGTVAAEPRRQQGPETLSRFMRRLHDGTRMPMVWRVVITLGGIIPAVLAITGIIMWLRTRGWRKRMAQRRREARAA